MHIVHALVRNERNEGVPSQDFIDIDIVGNAFEHDRRLARGKTFEQRDGKQKTFFLFREAVPYRGLDEVVHGVCRSKSSRRLVVEHLKFERCDPSASGGAHRLQLLRRERKARQREVTLHAPFVERKIDRADVVNVRCAPGRVRGELLRDEDDVERVVAVQGKSVDDVGLHFAFYELIIVDDYKRIAVAGTLAHDRGHIRYCFPVRRVEVSKVPGYPRVDVAEEVADSAPSFR